MGNNISCVEIVYDIDDGAKYFVINVDNDINKYNVDDKDY